MRIQTSIFRSLFLLTGLSACAPAAPEAVTETSVEELYGNQYYTSDCPSYLVSFHAEGVRRGRMASSSRAFEDCIEDSAAAAISAWDGDIGPYRPCDGDPFEGTGNANETDRLLRVARTANDLEVRCSGGSAGSNASTGIGDYWTEGREVFNWTNGRLQDFYDSAADQGWNNAYSDVANVTWHEVMHQHGYRHPEEGDGPGCGYTSYQRWSQSAPYIVGRCVRSVLRRSDAQCGLDACGHGGKMMIDRYDAEDDPVGCTCIEDPQDNEIGLIEYENGRLSHLTQLDRNDRLSSVSGAWAIADGDRVVAVGDFDESGSDDVLITGSRGLVIARFSTALRRLVEYVVHDYDDAFGSWQFGPDDRVVAVGDFLGTPQTELVLKSNWGIGIIYRSTSTNMLRAATLSAYGTYLGSWYLRSTDTIYGAGDFDGGDSDDEFVIQGTSGLAIIERTTAGMNALRHVTAGTSIGSYRYDANDIVQGIGDVNGDGRAEIILKGPSGLVILGYGSSGFLLYNRVAVDAYAGSWRLLSSDGVRAIGDFNDDGGDDLLLQRGGTVLGVLYRTTSGSLVEYVRDTFSQTPTVRAVGDFQGTGRDLILVDYPNGGMEMLSVGSTSIASIERNAYQDQVENTEGFWGTTAYFMLGSWPLQTTDYFPYTSAVRMDRRFRGVGDFDEDGREDFVIQN